MSVIQVEPSHYSFSSYVNAKRWASYLAQMYEALEVDPTDLLYIGVGDRIVTTLLGLQGTTVTTFDFDESLRPDIVGDVLSLTKDVNKQFDVVMCCQVLEHLPYESFERAIAELIQITRKRLVISLPYLHIMVLEGGIKIPKIPYLKFSIPVPQAWRAWTFDGEHHWEIGAKGYPERRIRESLEKFGRVSKSYLVKGNSYHRFYVVEPTVR